MKTKFKIIAAALGISAATYCSIGVAAAAPGFDNNRPMSVQQISPAAQYPAQEKSNMQQQYYKMEEHKRRCRGPWDLGLKSNKHLSIEDAHTIIEAALLMRGRHDLHVGVIRPLPVPAATSPRMQQEISLMKGVQLYYITIVNDKNRVVSRVLMNSGSGVIRPLYIQRVAIERQTR